MKLFDPKKGEEIEDFDIRIEHNGISAIDIFPKIVPHYWININPNGTFGSRKLILIRGTGKLDKDGNEIFDRDIVKTLTSHNFGHLPKGSELKVMWDGNELCYFLQNKKGNSKYRLTENKKIERLGSSLEKAKVENDTLAKD